MIDYELSEDEARIVHFLRDLLDESASEIIVDSGFLAYNHGLIQNLYLTIRAIETGKHREPRS